MNLVNRLRKFRESFDCRANHLLRIEVDSASLLHNIGVFRQQFKHQALSAVLKGNACGHGLKEVGLFLDGRREIKYFVVNNIIEARLLRDYGAKKPLLILEHVPKGILYKFKKIKDAALVVNSLDQVALLKEEINFPLMVHLKVDTGMNRQGVRIEDVKAACQLLAANKRLRVAGLLTHLADADSWDGEPSLKQLEGWRYALGIFKNYFGRGEFHFAATAGTRYLAQGESNLIRLGLGLYGYDPLPSRKLDLKPALSFWAKIVSIKDIKAGEGVSYNFTFRSDRPGKIAVLPCGYFEGVPRGLGNKGVVYFKERPLPILGRVCMNHMMVDVSGLEEKLNLEDEVEVFSARPQQLNSIENVSRLCGGIIHEVLSGISPTLKRYIV